MRKLPYRRRSIRFKERIPGYAFSVFITIGLYKDHTPAEVFIDVAKEGSDMRMALNVIGRLISMGLQAGVPLKKVIATISLPKENKVVNLPYTMIIQRVAEKLVEVSNKKELVAQLLKPPINITSV